MIKSKSKIRIKIRGSRGRTDASPRSKVQKLKARRERLTFETKAKMEDRGWQESKAKIDN